MLMKSRINARNDLHRRNLTQPMFEEEVPVEMSHIMGLPLSAPKGGWGGGASESRKTTWPVLPPSQRSQGPTPAWAIRAIAPQSSVCLH